MMITKEDFEKLQPFEADFRRAVNAGYKLPTRREEDDIVISVLLKYEPGTQVNRNCGNCMFNIYKRTGWKYFEFKEWFEKNPPKEEEVVEESQEPEVQKLKVRVVRKKKE